jgi:hypothetical protein
MRECSRPRRFLVLRPKPAIIASCTLGTLAQQLATTLKQTWRKQHTCSASAQAHVGISAKCLAQQLVHSCLPLIPTCLLLWQPQSAELATAVVLRTPQRTLQHLGTLGVSQHYSTCAS